MVARCHAWAWLHVLPTTNDLSVLHLLLDTRHSTLFVGLLLRG